MAKPQRAGLVRRHLTEHAPTTVAFGGAPPDHFTRLRAGVYVRTADWDDLFSESRLRTRADAVALRCKDPAATLSHVVAAAAWRLPLYRVRSDRIDMIFPHSHTRRNARDIVRHQAALPDDDVVDIDGHRVTSLDRTVYDVIRTTSAETAIVAYDAALRLIAWDDSDRTYDFEVAASFRALVDARIRANTGARGIRQARYISSIADGRAQLPGESITRLWVLWLGLPTPELQYRVDLLDGSFALLDMAWPERGRWWEFDGEIKYSDSDVMGGRTTEQVSADERRRQEAITRVTGWDCDRHGFERMSSFGEFAAYVRSIGMY